MIHLIPKNGARVRNPKTKLVVGPEGVSMPKLDTFWFKRVQDGSMQEAPQAEVFQKVLKDKGEK